MSNLMILTCPRPDVVDSDGTPSPFRYLRETIAQIEAEDTPLESRGIVCDGPYNGPTFDGWPVVEFDRHTDGMGSLRGNKLPYWHLLKLGFEMGGELLALEDDLRLARNAIRRMAAFPVPKDLAWVQFFAPHALPHELSYPGLWRPPGASSLFCQANKFTRAGLFALMQWRHDPEYVKFTESDVALAMACRRLGLRYGAHAPELVQHTGEISQCSGPAKLDDWRIARTWPGPDFDCMTLFARDDLYR